MRYIKKGISPEFFEKCKQGFSSDEDITWDKFSENQELSRCKKRLHDHLIEEQAGLCIYCERGVERENSHMEHIYPKDGNGGFPELVFEYDNLSVSCNGDACPVENKDIYKPEDIRSCGHKKSNAFDESFFLNPVVEENVSAFFDYDNNSGQIKAVDDDERAVYTLKLLNLDCTRLRLERFESVQAVFDVLLDSNNTLFRRLSKPERLQILLNRNPPFPFISFLRSYFAIAKADN